MYDIAIIGGGVVGGMIARRLSRYGVSVCILEKQSDVSQGASKANSGIVHAGYDAKPGTLKAKLNVAGAKMMEQTAKELGVKYCKNGSVVAAFDDQDMQNVKKLYDRGIENGVQNLEILDKEGIRKIEPYLAPSAVGALYAPEGAVICPYGLTIAAIGNAMDNGVQLKLNFEVQGITWTGEYYEIASSNQMIQAKYIINAAGVFTDKIAAMVGDTSFHIHPRKGEYLILDKACGHMARQTIFTVPSKMGKGILVGSTVDGNLILGPTAKDIEDKEDKSTTHDGIEKVMVEAKRVMPDVPLGQVITSFSGLRASADRGDFIIEQGAHRFINVAGIESPGLSAAPAIAVYVENILRDMGLMLREKADYDPHRKMHMPSKETFGRIVCRCETISEGKILQAIHTNPKAINIDAVKLRTRSGMGRCQGGFCMSPVAHMLAKQFGMDFQDITKFGGGSNIIVGKTKEFIDQ